MLDFIRRLITTFLIDNWTETPIALPNGKPLTIKGQPWIRLSIVPYTHTRSSAVEETTQVMDGDIVLQVFVVTGTGDGQATKLADAAADLFNGFSSIGMVCLTPREPIVRGDDGRGWYQIDVVIPFRAEVAR
jgi:hypothetical protein